MSDKIRIDIIVDVVCPWCYIGKYRLERAVDEMQDNVNFEIGYHPFELNPFLPESGVDQEEYLSRKFGGKDAYRQMMGRIARAARQENLEFDIVRQNVLPNTRKAHIMIALAKEFGVQPKVVDLLFKAYFNHGTDLSNEDHLVTLGREAGLPPESSKAAFANSSTFDVIVAEEEKWSRLGITGVPFYIIQDKWGISGAQPTATFVDALQKVALKTSQAT